jgi:hypothetical protein
MIQQLHNIIILNVENILFYSHFGQMTNHYLKKK